MSFYSRVASNPSLRFRQLVATITVAACTAAYATDAPAPRYPWDVRPMKCFAAPQSEGCALDDWPNFRETMRRIMYLYTAEQWVLLDRALAELTSTQKRFARGEMPANAAYWAFRRLMPGPGMRAAEGERVQRWAKAMPDSMFVPFVQARVLYASAYGARGAGYAGTVSKEGWELFAMRLRDAEKVLNDAPAALKETVLWHNLMLAIQLDLDKERAAEVFNQAVSKWPSYYDFYEVALSRMVPKWGGSYQQVDAFIRHWSTKQAAIEGESLYARLYSVMAMRNDVDPSETLLDWNTMRASFDDLVKRYPNDAFYRNQFASFACFARDKQTYARAMSMMQRHEVDSESWLDGHSLDACNRWANI